MTIHPSIPQRQHEHRTKLLGRQRPWPLHAVLGGKDIADILLWRKKKLSATILTGFTAVWFLFEVVEYPFLTLLCHFLIIAMLSIFIWNNAAGLISWNPPNVKNMELPESTCLYIISKANRILLNLFEISSGVDLKLFSMAIICIWVLSVTATYFTFLNLLYIVYLCVQTLPFLYERYEREVDYLGTRGNHDLRNLYAKFESQVLEKIPRGPVKANKFT